MKNYILTLLAASLAAAVVELLSPKGEGDRLVSHIRMIGGLFLLVVLLDPLRTGISLLRDAAAGDLPSRVESLIPSAIETNYDAVFGDSLTNLGEAEVESWAMAILETHFGVSSEDCLVAVDCAYEADTLFATELRIALWGRSALEDPHPIEVYFTEQLGCPCYVTVGAP